MKRRIKHAIKDLLWSRGVIIHRGGCVDRQIVAWSEDAASEALFGRQDPEAPRLRALLELARTDRIFRNLREAREGRRIIVAPRNSRPLKEEAAGAILITNELSIASDFLDVSSAVLYDGDEIVADAELASRQNLICFASIAQPCKTGERVLYQGVETTNPEEAFGNPSLWLHASGAENLLRLAMLIDPDAVKLAEMDAGQEARLDRLLSQYRLVFAARQKESRSDRGPNTGAGRPPDRVLISLNPDLRDSMGHYLHYDLTVQREFEKEENGVFLTAAHVFVSKELVKNQVGLIPAFQSEAVSFAGIKSIPRMAFFIEELRALVHEIRCVFPTSRLDFYYYQGNVTVAQALNRYLKYSDDQKISFHVNLFYEHFPESFALREDREILNELRALMAEKQDALYIYTDTDKLQDRLQNKLGRTFLPWSMFSITGYSAEAISAARKRETGRKLRIVFPGNQSVGKRWEYARETAERIVKDLASFPAVEVILRDLKGDPALARLEQKYEGRIRVERGSLSEETYRALLEEADIVVIPYSLEYFRTRTSGVFADSLLLHKPVVAARDTWMGDIIESRGVGKTFTDGNPNSMLEAIRESILHHELLRSGYESDWVDETFTAAQLPFLKKA